MTTWSQRELDQIATAREALVAPLRADRSGHCTPTRIWCVAVDGALYARAYTGQASRWYRAAIASRVGRIVVAGPAEQVAFAPIDGPINDRIDDAYCAKYRDSPYLAAMIGADVRATTLEILPRSEI